MDGKNLTGRIIPISERQLRESMKVIFQLANVKPVDNALRHSAILYYLAMFPDVGVDFHTDRQSQRVETSMGASGGIVLKLRLVLDNEGCGDMAKEKNTPSDICLELALLALQRAMSGIQLIEECDINASEFRAHLPAVLDELKKAKYFLSGLKTAPASMPIFFDN